MKIVVTAKEIMNKLVWDEFCKLKGISVWAANEGLVDSGEEFELSENEALELGFLTILSAHC